jgi:twitching motility protein PilT
MSSLKHFAFADLYLGHPSLDDRYCALPGARVVPLPPDAALRQDCARLLAACRATLDALPDGAAEFRQEHGEAQYRVAVMPTPRGAMFVLRKLAGSIGSLAELGIPPAYVRRMLDPGLGGLFVIAGGPKMGKTTTACAMVKERLAAFGGVAVTAEVPAELPLEGAHGDGVCYQTVGGRDTRGFIDRLRDSARWGAGMVLVHEIVEPRVAAEVLRASSEGRLVIATMVGEDPVRTLGRLHTMADAHLGQGAARALLADGLAGILHQRLPQAPEPVQAGQPRRLETEFLQLQGAPEARRLLRDGHFDQLRQAMQQQVNNLLRAPAGVFDLRERA